MGSISWTFYWYSLQVFLLTMSLRSGIDSGFMRMLLHRRRRRWNGLALQTNFTLHCTPFSGQIGHFSKHVRTFETILNVFQIEASFFQLNPTLSKKFWIVFVQVRFSMTFFGNVQLTCPEMNTLKFYNDILLRSNSSARRDLNPHLLTRRECSVPYPPALFDWAQHSLTLNFWICFIFKEKLLFEAHFKVQKGSNFSSAILFVSLPPLRQDTNCFFWKIKFFIKFQSSFFGAGQLKGAVPCTRLWRDGFRLIDSKNSGYTYVLFAVPSRQYLRYQSKENHDELDEFVAQSLFLTL